MFAITYPNIERKCFPSAFDLPRIISFACTYVRVGEDVERKVGVGADAYVFKSERCGCAGISLYFAENAAVRFP